MDALCCSKKNKPNKQHAQYVDTIIIHMSLLFLHDDFNTGLFSCFDDQPSCMDGFFCPCCAVSAEYNMLKHRKTGSVPHVYLPLFVLNFFTWGLALSCFSVVTRNMLRRTFLFSHETELSSCCKAFLCTPCSICQVYRELSIRHAWPDGVCVGSTPYVKHGLAVPPPNPDRMGAAPPQQWAAQQQPPPPRENALPATGQPVYGYPVQHANSVQQYDAPGNPTKPVYGYNSAHGGQAAPQLAPPAYQQRSHSKSAA